MSTTYFSSDCQLLVIVVILENMDTERGEEKPSHKLPSALDDIKSVETPHSFNASNGILYKNAEFGRDARQLGADALVFNPEVTKKILRALVKRQALKRNDITEAQPGKFHHEHRELYVNGKRIPDSSAAILKELSQKWGGSTEKITYYGSCDVTPDTISLIADVAKGDSTFLSEKVVNQDKGHEMSIKESAQQGIQWVQDRILYGPTITPQNDVVQKFLIRNNLMQFLPHYQNHILRNLEWMHHHVISPFDRFRPHHKRVKLLEFLRTNAQGITYQGWMDGGTSLIHGGSGKEGLLADYRQPIATIEMQASAYDALVKASFLFPKKAKRLTQLAHEVRDNTIKYLWNEQAQYFAMGLDRDKKGELQSLQTFGANAGEILNSSFFDDLDESERKKYIGGIVQMIFSDEFLTDARVRTRAKSQAYLSDLSPEHNQPNSPQDYWDYQGSETSWIVQTGRIAEGLRRQGLYALAEQLDNRILNTVNICGYNLEYVYVGARGKVENRVAYNIQDRQTLPAIPLKTAQPAIVTIAATNIPEFIQTWTASRVAAIKHRMGMTNQTITQPDTWQHSLEQEILTNLRQKNELQKVLSPEEVHTIREHAPLFVVDQQRGRELEEEIKARSEAYYLR